MKSRNYGIDLLKILSMYMVVVLHILHHGGIMTGCEPGMSQLSAQLLHTASFCAVNLFGLTTGYLMGDRRVKYGRVVDLWLQVVFYCVVISAAACLLGKAVSLRGWLGALAPVTFKSYWYFSAYFGLFFLMPYLNAMLSALSKRQDRGLALVLVVLFFLVSCLSPEDAFAMRDGYSLIWLLILYVTGALLRKYAHRVTLSSWWLVGGYLAMVLLTVVSQYAIEAVTTSIAGNLLLQYDSVTVVAMAVFLMLLFSRIRLPSALQKAVAVLSPLSFAVYIIHEQPIVKADLIQDRFVSLGELHWAVMIAGVLMAAAAIYIMCTVIEFSRVKLFALLKISSFSDKLGHMLGRVLTGEGSAQGENKPDNSRQ